MATFMACDLGFMVEMQRQTLAVDTTILPQACLLENLLAMQALNTDLGVWLPFLGLWHDDKVLCRFRLNRKACFCT